MVFTTETTTKPLCEITIHDATINNSLRTERTLTVDNVELIEETLDLLFKMMDRGKYENNPTA
jgi:hypothetical protein